MKPEQKKILTFQVLPGVDFSNNIVPYRYVPVTTPKSPILIVCTIYID